MEGSPVVARTVNAMGHRTGVIPLPVNDDRLAVLDADRERLLAAISFGLLPIAAVTSADGSVSWVTVFGGARPADTGVRSASQCCDRAAELARVDERGIAEPGQVARWTPSVGE